MVCERSNVAIHGFWISVIPAEMTNPLSLAEISC